MQDGWHTASDQNLDIFKLLSSRSLGGCVVGILFLHYEYVVVQIVSSTVDCCQLSVQLRVLPNEVVVS